MYYRAQKIKYYKIKKIEHIFILKNIINHSLNSFSSSFSENDYQLTNNFNGEFLPRDSFSLFLLFSSASPAASGGSATTWSLCGTLRWPSCWWSWPAASPWLPRTQCAPTPTETRWDPGADKYFQKMLRGGTTQSSRWFRLSPETCGVICVVYLYVNSPLGSSFELIARKEGSICCVC